MTVIRTTEEGLVSLLDVVKLATGSKNPRELWKRAELKNPELQDKVSVHQFPGPGQKPTLVTTRSHADYVAVEVGGKPKSSEEVYANFFDRATGQS